MLLNLHLIVLAREPGLHSSQACFICVTLVDVTNGLLRRRYRLVVRNVASICRASDRMWQWTKRHDLHTTPPVSDDRLPSDSRSVAVFRNARCRLTCPRRRTCVVVQSIIISNNPGGNRLRRTHSLGFSGGTSMRLWLPFG